MRGQKKRWKECSALIGLNKICNMITCVGCHGNGEQKRNAMRFLISEFLSREFNMETGLCERETVRDRVYVSPPKPATDLSPISETVKKIINISQNYFSLVYEQPSL
jgi:hypothetical protein